MGLPSNPEILQQKKYSAGQFLWINLLRSRLSYMKIGGARYAPFMKATLCGKG